MPTETWDSLIGSIKLEDFNTKIDLINLLQNQLDFFEKTNSKELFEAIQNNRNLFQKLGSQLYNAGHWCFEHPFIVISICLLAGVSIWFLTEYFSEVIKTIKKGFLKTTENFWGFVEHIKLYVKTNRLFVRLLEELINSPQKITKVHNDMLQELTKSVAELRANALQHSWDISRTNADIAYITQVILSHSPKQ